ncbi:MAG: CehA/McbA family metallohydrolase [Clostridia bacterium]|nr:CehA/McbA family metallohydrolase [Clostridia bacterium]
MRFPLFRVRTSRSWLAATLLFAVLFGSMWRSPQASAEKLNFYFGNLHSHTSYSDGVLTPSDAFAHARDVAKMDFLAVTEHGYYLQESTNIHLWYRSLEEAEAFYQPGVFLPLVGFEWTYGPGHMCGHDTPLAASRDIQRDLPAFAAFLRDYRGIGVFNHPNYDIQPNWDDFLYLGEADKWVSLIEVGSGPYRHNVKNERAYIRSLDRGWRVGAVSNQDNHRADWGTAAPTRTGILAPELTREAVYAAMREMRTYATEDRNTRVLFSCGDVMMGGESVISADDVAAGRPVGFSIVVEDPDPGDSFELVQVITDGGKVAWELAPGAGGRFEARFELVPEQAYNWYYVRVVQADSDLIVTSPIWVATGSGIAVCDFGCGDRVPRAGAPVRVTAEIVNRNEEAILGAMAALYASSGGIRSLVGSVVLDLPAGRGTGIKFEWTPSEPGEVGLEMEVYGPGSQVGDVFVGAAARVRTSDVTRVMIDEGHNNRSAGYHGAYAELLRAADYSPSINEGPITDGLLSNTDILVVNAPEIGFSLTPTSFEANEIQAMARFVKRGGSLLLAGWSNSDDGSRTCDQLNEVLAQIGSSIRFGYDELRAGRVPIVEVAWTGGDGKPAYAGEACSLLAADWTSLDAISDVKVFARAPKAASAQVAGDDRMLVGGQSPVFAAGQVIDRGRVACLGSPVYSARDLAREGYSNARFTLDVMSWLVGGEW